MKTIRALLFVILQLGSTQLTCMQEAEKVASAQERVFLKSPYCKIFELISEVDLARITHFLNKHLCGGVQANMIERHIIFIKYILNVFHDTNDAYSQKGTSTRLKWVQDVLNTNEPWKESYIHWYIHRRRWDAIFAQSFKPSDRQRPIFADFKILLRNILVSFERKSYDALPALTEYQSLSENDRGVYETALRVSRLAPACKDTVRDCVLELYKICNPHMTDSEIAQEIQKQAQEFDHYLENVQVQQYGSLSPNSQSLNSETSAFYDLLRLFAQKELTDLLYLLSAPQLPVDIARGVLLNFAITANGQMDVNEHPALTSLLTILMKPRSGESQEISNFLNMLQAGKRSYVVLENIYDAMTPEKKAAFLKAIHFAQAQMEQVPKASTSSNGHNASNSNAGQAKSDQAFHAEDHQLPAQSRILNPQFDFRALKDAQGNALGEMMKIITREGTAHMQRIQACTLKRKIQLTQELEKKRAKTVATLQQQAEEEVAEKQSLETQTKELEDAVARLQALIQTHKEG